jgi:hypothetical protein
MRLQVGKQLDQRQPDLQAQQERQQALQLGLQVQV